MSLGQGSTFILDKHSARLQRDLTAKSEQIMQEHVKILQQGLDCYMQAVGLMPDDLRSISQHHNTATPNGSAQHQISMIHMRHAEFGSFGR